MYKSPMVMTLYNKKTQALQNTQKKIILSDIIENSFDICEKSKKSEQ